MSTARWHQGWDYPGVRAPRLPAQGRGRLLDFIRILAVVYYCILIRACGRKLSGVFLRKMTLLDPLDFTHWNVLELRHVLE